MQFSLLQLPRWCQASVRRAMRFNLEDAIGRPAARMTKLKLVGRYWTWIERAFIVPFANMRAAEFVARNQATT